MPIAMPLVILCGGKSSRMGRLKQNLIFDTQTTNRQKTLADFQVEHLQGQFSKIYFSAKFTILNAFGVETILDNNTPKNLNVLTCKNLPKGEFAPIFGLQSILESLQCDVFVISIDTPFFDKDCIESIYQAYIKNHKPTFAKNSKIHPLLGIYTLDSLMQIQRQITQNNYKLTNLLSTINAQCVEIEEPKTQNLNTLEDYQQALAQIKA